MYCTEVANALQFRSYVYRRSCVLCHIPPSTRYEVATLATLPARSAMSFIYPGHLSLPQILSGNEDTCTLQLGDGGVDTCTTSDKCAAVLTASQ